MVLMCVLMCVVMCPVRCNVLCDVRYTVLVARGRGLGPKVEADGERVVMASASRRDGAMCAPSRAAGVGPHRALGRSSIRDDGARRFVSRAHGDAGQSEINPQQEHGI